MAKTRLEPAATETVEGYVSELSRELRRRLPAQAAAQAAAETEAHLRDRVTDLVACGADIRTATEEAVAGFGGTRVYAEALAGARYDTRAAASWRRVGLLAVAGFLALVIAYALMPLGVGRFNGGTVLRAMVSFWGVAMLASFCGRRSQTRRYVALTGTAAVALFFAAGSRFVPFHDTPSGPLWPPAHELLPTRLSREGVRPGIPMGKRPERAYFRGTLQMNRRETTLLREGLEAYSQRAPVPASLRVGSAYLVPSPLRTHGYLKTSPFRYGAIITNEYGPTAYAVRRSSPVHTRPTYEEARQKWLAHGPKWLRQHAQEEPRLQEAAAFYERVAAGPERFNIAAATYVTTLALWFALWLVILPDLVLARLGRGAYRRARAVRQEWREWRTWRASREDRQALTQ